MGKYQVENKVIHLPSKISPKQNLFKTKQIFLNGKTCSMDKKSLYPYIIKKSWNLKGGRGTEEEIAQ